MKNAKPQLASKTCLALMNAITLFRKWFRIRRLQDRVTVGTRGNTKHVLYVLYFPLVGKKKEKAPLADPVCVLRLRTENIFVKSPYYNGPDSRTLSRALNITVPTVIADR